MSGVVCFVGSSGGDKVSYFRYLDFLYIVIFFQDGIFQKVCVIFYLDEEYQGSFFCLDFIEKGKGMLDFYFWFLLMVIMGFSKVLGKV